MIKKIIHISDIHIKKNELHDNYKQVFLNLFDDLKYKLDGYKKEEVRIVITGDIFHDKISISNEQVLLVNFLFNNLIKFGKVVILPGNHDFLMNNMGRVDSITPVIQFYEEKDLIYYKEGGEYIDYQIKWIVFSLYENNRRPSFTKNKDYYNIGLYHGTIQGLSTDLGFTFEEGYDKMNFVGLDLLLAGDIHLRQKFMLPNNSYGYMIGSLIQQDFGEGIKNHGYGMFDFMKKEYSFHDVKNPNPFYHFKIQDINDILENKEEFVNNR